MNFFAEHTGLAIGLIAGAAAAIIAILASGYVKAPPDKAYIISGMKKTPKILIGRAGIKLPFLERKDTLVLKNYKTKEAITNLVYEERHRELMFEGKRYYDLVRRSRREGNTEYLAAKCSNKDTNLQSIIQSKMKKMDAIYWPYNLDEIKVNPYLKQNSAFGSGESSSIEAN